MDIPFTEQSIEPGFPLHCLLLMYIEGDKHGNLFVQNFKNFKLLVSWLAPIAIPDKDSIPHFNIPPLCGSYELQEIAKIVGCEQYVVWRLIQDMYPIS